MAALHSTLYRRQRLFNVYYVRLAEGDCMWTSSTREQFVTKAEHVQLRFYVYVEIHRLIHCRITVDLQNFTRKGDSRFVVLYSWLEEMNHRHVEFYSRTLVNSWFQVHRVSSNFRTAYRMQQCGGKKVVSQMGYVGLINGQTETRKMPPISTNCYARVHRLIQMM